jgi:hypothetical protein
VKVLHTWLEGVYAGVFTVRSEGRVIFEYADNAPATPISETDSPRP